MSAATHNCPKASCTVVLTVLVRPLRKWWPCHPVERWGDFQSGSVARSRHDRGDDLKGHVALLDDVPGYNRPTVPPRMTCWFTIRPGHHPAPDDD